MAAVINPILVAIANPSVGMNKAVRRASGAPRAVRAPALNCSMPYRQPCPSDRFMPPRSNSPL